jgi:hypothetical protein
MLDRLMRCLVLASFFALGAGGASAEVILRFAPADTTVEQGSVNRLSIICDDVLDLRTIEVFVEFDPEIVGSVSGGSGALFTDGGFNLFDGFELTEPNQWHGYCVIMGAYDYITCPGELFYWDFEALADGVSPIVSVSVALAAPDASIVPDVSLPSTTITVGIELSPVSEIPHSEQGLRCFPNPFNPRTEIQFELARDETVDLSVFNLQGHRVAQLHQGHASEGVFTASWDGRDDEGQAQPGGVYLFRLETPTVISVIKGVLVK